MTESKSAAEYLNSARVKYEEFDDQGAIKLKT